MRSTTAFVARSLQPEAFPVLQTSCKLRAWGYKLLFLPARLHDAGDLSLERQRAETQAADAKLPQVSPRSSAELAPVVFAGAELRLPRVLHSLCSGCHNPLLQQQLL